MRRQQLLPYLTLQHDPLHHQYFENIVFLLSLVISLEQVLMVSNQFSIHFRLMKFQLSIVCLSLEQVAYEISALNCSKNHL